mmetsp:Transcript_28926/g.99716  ORF Transcript_28926/g.99716 Transcript_28926/m.99716 type:complete len:91 (+) Transcript_28926:1-273(+)
MAAEFQDRLADSLAPEKDLHDVAPYSRSNCTICADSLPISGDGLTLVSCCCKYVCTGCAVKLFQDYKTLCPFCRAPAPASTAEYASRLMQ